jgi:alcohol dehydrogenase, propanol-preferring
MKAAVLHKPGSPLVIEEVAEPHPGPGEILIKVKACGVCHTDLHLVAGEWRLPRLPLILGHEVAGEVEAVGEGTLDFKAGDRAGIPWIYSSCGTCEYCTTDREPLCPAIVVTGYMVDGGFAEYIVAPASHAVQIPPGLSFQSVAPLFCAGLTSYRALKVSGARLGDSVAIWGAGGLGHYAIQIARLMGAKVIAVDIDQARLELARELGAEVTLNAIEQDAAKAIRALGGARVVLCLAPATQAIERGFQSLARGGTLVLVGMPPGSFTLPVFGAVAKGIRILTSAVGTRQDLCELLALAAAGKIRTASQGVSLPQINEVLDNMRQSRITGRMVLEFP